MIQLSEHWDDTIAASREDEAQLKRDMVFHPRTSNKSLRELARMTSTQGSLHVTRRLDDMYEWLSTHRDKLPREVEDEDGNRNSDQRLERLVDDYEQLLLEADDELTTETGLYDVAGHGCYAPLTAIAARNQEDAELLNEFGLIQPVWSYLMSIRGGLLQDYMHKAEQRRLLGSNPERYGMDAVLRRGLTRTVAKSNAVPVPDNVAELLSYADGVLKWKVARGAKAAGAVADADQLKLLGVKYSRNRIIYRLVHGADAGDLNVSEDGLTASPYRDNVKVSISERGDGNYDVVVNLPKPHTLAECETLEEAEAVRSGILWTINHL